MNTKYWYDIVKIHNFDLLIIVSQNGICWIDIIKSVNLALKKAHKHIESLNKSLNLNTIWTRNQQIIKKYKLLLEDFFNKKKFNLDNITDLKGTPLTLNVWKELQTIDFGQTITYKNLATKIGKPRAIRAVANAVAKNPLLFLIPCHRVIATKKQDMYKYRCGSEIKRKLLDWEQKP